MGESPSSPAPRLTWLDAYRGFIMLAMATWGLGIPKVAEHFPYSTIWQMLSKQFSHAAWAGCSFWDLIQPSFMFMVGVAMPFSHANRLARGQGRLRIASHVLYRALLLVLLGIFLSSNSSARTNFTFVNVLTQIGLGYAFVYLLIGRGPVVQLLAALAILGGYWFLFFDPPLAVPSSFPANLDLKDGYEAYTGLFAHWNKHTNFATAVDQWFLKFFAPNSDSYPFNKGGYQTLNFVPSMATMIFGLIAGELLKGPREGTKKLGILLLSAVLCLGVGYVLSLTVCPSVKRIWTPSWTIFSTGWTLGMLAAFYAAIDLHGYRRWAFPLVVVGMNSIAMYCMAQLIHSWIGRTLKTHLNTGREMLLKAVEGDSLKETLQPIFGQPMFEGTYGPMVQATGTVLVLWLICWGMYRRGIFLRI